MSERLADSDDDEHRGRLLPVDPDVGAAAEAARRRDAGAPFERTRRSRWPRVRLDVVGAVFVGGCAGGYSRYALSTMWPPATGAFPWAVFAANVAGAFVLALVIVVAIDATPSRYLRPLVGTGFCGALTTFSSVVVSTDQLFAHHHPGVATAYLLSTTVAGLAASALGLMLGRAVAAIRRRARYGRRPE